MDGWMDGMESPIRDRQLPNATLLICSCRQDIDTGGPVKRHEHGIAAYCPVPELFSCLAAYHKRHLFAIPHRHAGFKRSGSGVR